MLSSQVIPAPLLPEFDPFPASPRVSSYVAVPSHEQVLAYLEAKLRAEPGVVELSGAGGVGKSLLMRVLAHRFGERFETVHVPIPTLSPSEFATWVEHSGIPESRLDLRGWWRHWRRRETPRLLLVEDAQHLSEETRAWIEAYCTERDARAVLAYTEELRARPAEARRTFVEPLGIGEVEAYVECHLQQSGASLEVRQLFEGEAAHTLALQSRGIPRAIHRIADERLLALAALARPEESTPPDPELNPPKHRRSRGDFMAGVCGALFLGSLMLSVPSPLSETPPASALGVGPSAEVPIWRTATGSSTEVANLAPGPERPMQPPSSAAAGNR